MVVFYLLFFKKITFLIFYNTFKKYQFIIFLNFA